MIQEKIELLNKATEAYDLGHPIMSDEDWDNLYFEVKSYEEKTGDINPTSPTQIISYNIVSSFEKVKHNHPMLSLNKTKSLDEVKSFIDNKPFIVMCKMDGLTLSLSYENGFLVSAETRGDGEVGENIYSNALVISSIPKTIPIKEPTVIDGEIISTYENFEKFSTSYRNPRNFAAGSIRLLDSRECADRNLTFVAWDIIKGSKREFLSDKLEDLERYGFLTVPYRKSASWIDCTEELKSEAEKLSYPIDGLVYKFDNCPYFASLGVTSHHFKGGLAYKFYDEVYYTNLLDIEYGIGRTGVLTPIAVFDPVEIEGSVVEKASLHNLSIMQELLGKPYRNQKVGVYKANLIIPQIYDAEKIDDGADFIPSLKICPVCGCPTKIVRDNETDVLMCINPDCDGKFINKLDHFCGKSGLDIKGLSKATLEKLVSWGWINNFNDIYLLKDHAAEWKSKEGFGNKSVSNILIAIEDSKEVSLDSFIAAIGIPQIGKTLAKDLLNHIDSWKDFRDKINSRFDFSTLDGFADSKTSAILNFNYDEADKVAKQLKFLVKKPTELTELKFVITGKVNIYKNRDELSKAIEQIGGKVVSSVSKNTDYLINNDINSQSTKNKTAQKLGIPIITEENFIKNFIEKT